LIAWCTLLKREGPPTSRKMFKKKPLKNIRKFTEVHLVIVREFRILKKNSFSKS